MVLYSNYFKHLSICDQINLILFFFQQWRLLPYLAAAYALDYFSKSLFENFIEFFAGVLTKQRSQRQVRCLHIPSSLSSSCNKLDGRPI